MQEGRSRDALRIWLAIAGSATLVLGAAYAMVQQSARLAANDEPLAAVRMAKEKLAEGESPNEIVPQNATDLRSDAGVFVIITDSSKKILASSAILDEEAALPPPAVFDYTTQHGEDSFTWEPKAGVRHATEVLKYDDNGGGFIVAGQSLERVETRVGTYNLIAFLTWLAVITWTMIILFPKPQNIVRRVKRKTTK